MSNIQSFLREDPNYIRQRRKEYSNLETSFARHLGTIILKMPAPKRVLDLSTGEWTMIPDPKWQSLIDRITNQFNTYIEKEFSDLK